MHRPEITDLLSAGTAAEREGRMDDASACAEALIRALRDARSKRSSDAGGTRAADNEAISWAIDILHGTGNGTPV
jgi:hypothetical protein